MPTLSIQKTDGCQVIREHFENDNSYQCFKIINNWCYLSGLPEWGCKECWNCHQQVQRNEHSHSGCQRWLREFLIFSKKNDLLIFSKNSLCPSNSRLHSRTANSTPKSLIFAKLAFLIFAKYADFGKKISLSKAFPYYSMFKTCSSIFISAFIQTCVCII